MQIITSVSFPKELAKEMEKQIKRGKIFIKVRVHPFGCSHVPTVSGRKTVLGDTGCSTQILCE